MKKNKNVFKPSGSFDTYIEGPILITSVSGSWNLEMHLQSRIQAQPLIEMLETTGQPWAVIVQFADTMLTNPEVLLAGRNAVVEMIPKTNLMALAWVTSENIIGYPLLVPRYKEVYKDVLKSDFFTNIEDAKIWLKGLISEKKINHGGH